MIEVKVRIVPFGSDYESAELIGEVLIGNLGGTRNDRLADYEARARELTHGSLVRADVPPFYPELGEAREWQRRVAEVRGFPRLEMGALHLVARALDELGFTKEEVL